MDWVASILASKHWTPHRLAVEAGLSPSALNKFLKDPTGTRTLNSYSVEKLVAASGMALDGMIATPPRQGVDAEAKLVPAPDRFKDMGNVVSFWEVCTRALELVGYVPGDILVVDESLDARPGDIIVAKVFDRSGNSEFIVRIYEQSYLRAATTDPDVMVPILMSKDVQICGVMVHSVRNRRAA
ncbi:LexA family protein [Rhizobium panacihumi]|uniref:LexA family protein n=1 Tax=Rhizobium panacihumi TaxID=2008450 RepID=UPI003D7B2937